MSLEELKRTVLNKAKLEAEEIIRDAYEKAKNIIKEAEEKKKAIIEEERKKIISELRLEAKLAEARREARLIIAKAKQEIVEDIKKRVREILENMSLENRRSSLKKLLYESLEELEKCGFEVEGILIHISPKDKDIMVDILRELKINAKIVENPSLTGGLLISTSNDEVSIDNTYEARVEKILRTVLIEVFRGV
ncbi:MAG: V-type ATP synthase subunit E [Desulfurococcaceae archaeon]|nr:V-type ATP synthase subunit E [Desulfurococcaceae archaeon]